MRARDVVVCAVAVVAVVTIVNLLTGNKRLKSSLPVTRLEHDRQESLRIPFHERQHRLERAARLEGQLAGEEQQAGSQKNIRHGIGQTSHQIEAVERQSSFISGSKIDDDSATVEDAANKANAVDESAGSYTVESTASNYKYHVVSSVGSGVYLEWQVRLCYYSYLKMQREHPDSAMGGFTRLLHTGEPDHLMDEIPTVIVDPLPDDIVRGYQVINRPYAFHQWVHRHMDNITEDYIFMAEPDHVFIRPPPLWATPDKAAAYPFWYIQPLEHQTLLSRFNEAGADFKDMRSIGNSPAILHKNQMRRAVDVWYPLSVRFKKDPEADVKLGWILDMYAWSVACAQAAGGPIPSDLHPEFMLQPPFDLTMDVRGSDAFIVHLTYGMDFSEQGVMTYGKVGTGFHFDKRDYASSYPPRNLTLPHFVQAPCISYFLSLMNEASEVLKWPTQ